MKKNIFLNLILISLGFILFSCSDKLDDPQSTIDADEQRIQRYISDNNLNASRSNSGLYHIVDVDSSMARKPVASDVIEISYKVSLLETGEVFGEQDNYTFQPSVGSFMTGLTEGVLLMGEGGKSTFLVPSHLAFASATGTLGGVFVPENSIVILEIVLKDVRSLAEQEKVEDQIIKDYMTANDLIPTSDSLGVYRIVVQQGGTNRPQDLEKISVSYSGKVLNGEPFDSSEYFPFTVKENSLISGWNIGIAMMHKKEKATIIIPSHLAYGAGGSGSRGNIPPFTPIVFTIEILE